MPHNLIHQYILHDSPVEPSDHVDTPQLIKRGIKLGYTPDVLNEAGETETLVMFWLRST